MYARCGTRESFTDDRRAMQSNEFNPKDNHVRFAASIKEVQ